MGSCSRCSSDCVGVHLYSQNSQVLGADVSPGYVLCWMVIYTNFREGSSVVLSTPKVTPLLFFNLYSKPLLKYLYNRRKDFSSAILRP